MKKIDKRDKKLLNLREVLFNFDLILPFYNYIYIYKRNLQIFNQRLKGNP